MWEADDSRSIDLPAQTACAVLLMEGDLEPPVSQGPVHFRSEIIGPSLVPFLGPVSSLCFQPQTLPKASFSSSLRCLPVGLWILTAGVGLWILTAGVGRGGNSMGVCVGHVQNELT